MSAYHDLVQKGIRIRLRNDGNLGLSPAYLITEEIEQCVVEHKPEIINHLNKDPDKRIVARPVKRRKIQQRSAVVQNGVIFKGGVGTELKRLIPNFFKRSGCGCRDYARHLDQQGIAWCEANQGEVIVQAKQRAREAFARSDELNVEVLGKAIKNAKESFYAWQAKGRTIIEMPDDLMRIDPIAIGSGRAIVTMMIGEEIQEQARYTLPSIKAYAQRCGADLHVITDDRCPEFPLANKFRVAEIASHYDRTLFLDIDVFIKPTAPDIFDAHPPGSFYIHPDISKNTKGISHLKNYMALVGDVDSQTLWEQSDVNNTGVVLFDREHRDAWEPPQRLPDFHCAEQDWVGYQLLRKKIPVVPLAHEWNCQYWWRDFEEEKPKSHIIHLATCKDKKKWEPIFQSLNPMKRIVVATTPRTGSSLLVDSLGQHPWGLSAGEVFNPDYPGERWPIGVCNIAKVFPWGKDEPQYNSIFDGSLIVYLYRADRTAQVESWKRALETGIWRNDQGDPWYGQWSESVEAYIDEADQLYRDRADIVISYEDLVASWDTITSKILAAARWPAMRLTQSMSKLNHCRK